MRPTARLQEDQNASGRPEIPMPAARKKSSRSSKKPTARRSLPKAEFVSVAVVVASRKKSLEWYTKRLGLDVIQSIDHWVTVGRAGKPGVIHLCQTSEYDPSIPLEQIGR